MLFVLTAPWAAKTQRGAERFVMDPVSGSWTLEQLDEDDGRGEKFYYWKSVKQ
jgi:hypothetical protein